MAKMAVFYGNFRTGKLKGAGADDTGSTVTDRVRTDYVFLFLFLLNSLMVHRPSDSRLLNSLLSNEKEYHKQLLVLLDNYSQQSLGAFAAYASASPAHVARAVIAVAGSFAGADDALRRYAVSIETWQAELRTLKDLEEEVGNVMRDREILFVRLFSHRIFVLATQQIRVQRDASH